MMLIAALLTPTGRGAVATIGYCGPISLIDDASLFRAANRRPLAEQSVDLTLFGRWGLEPGEEVVLCRTSATTLEIHCHGGHAASTAILETLASLGCARLDSWDYLEQTQGVFPRETARALAEAPTPRTAAIIAHQAAGPLREAVDRLASENLTADDLRVQIDEILSQAVFGRHLTQAWQVVLFGRPNVGKSSLMNALAGFQRAIVLDSPGTTRDLVTAEIALDGWPIRLTDTAGLRSGADEIETSGILRAQMRLSQADLRILVLDRSAPPTREELRMIEDSPEAIMAANKCDLADAWNGALPETALSLSATTGDGLIHLSTEIVDRLIPTIPAPATPIPISLAQIEILTSARAALDRGEIDSARALCKTLS